MNNGKRAAILVALSDGPKTNRQLQEIVDDCGGYVSRLLHGMIDLGTVENIRPGARALYQLTAQGRAKVGDHP